MLVKGRSSHRRIILEGTGKGQKQPLEVFYEKTVLKKFVIFKETP